MPKTKKRSRKPAVQVADLTAKKNPKGGFSDLTIQKVVDKTTPVLFSTATTTNTK
jgi:type VI protein secretion system component Hcp